MGFGDTIDYMTFPSGLPHNKKPPISIGTWIAAFFFGLFCTLVVIWVGWLLLTSPYKVETHEREGRTFECSYFRDGDIRCRDMADSDVGGGRLQP